MLDKAPVPAAAGDAGEADPEEKNGKDPAGAPHVLIVTTPDGRLRFLQALGSRRKGSVGAGIPAAFAGHLMTDGYTGYQHLLSRLAGIQQCCQHIIRRCRAVTKLGPGGLQSWAGDIIAILREAHQAVEQARARGDTALGAEVLDSSRQRYDEAAAFGIIHNRLRDWHEGNHPGYALGCWLRDYKKQVFLFTRDFAVDWTANVAERGAKAAKRHQAVSGYWHSLATPHPVVPHPQLPRFGCRPRHHRTRRHPRRAHRETLATATARCPLTPIHGTPVNGHSPRWAMVSDSLGLIPASKGVS